MTIEASQAEPVAHVIQAAQRLFDSVLPHSFDKILNTQQKQKRWIVDFEHELHSQGTAAIPKKLLEIESSLKMSAMIPQFPAIRKTVVGDLAAMDSFGAAATGIEALLIMVEPQLPMGQIGRRMDDAFSTPLPSPAKKPRLAPISWDRATELETNIVEQVFNVKVKKFFMCHGEPKPFLGDIVRIKSFRGTRTLKYMVEYSDGDLEDLSLVDFIKHAVSCESESCLDSSQRQALYNLHSCIEDLIGTKIVRGFKDAHGKEEMFPGQVDSITRLEKVDAPMLYRVIYCDDDEEDITLDELFALRVTGDGTPGRRKAEKSGGRGELDGASSFSSSFAAAACSSFSVTCSTSSSSSAAAAKTAPRLPLDGSDGEDSDEVEVVGVQCAAASTAMAAAGATHPAASVAVQSGSDASRTTDWGEGSDAVTGSDVVDGTSCSDPTNSELQSAKAVEELQMKPAEGEEASAMETAGVGEAETEREDARVREEPTEEEGCGEEGLTMEETLELHSGIVGSADADCLLPDMEDTHPGSDDTVDLGGGSADLGGGLVDLGALL